MKINLSLTEEEYEIYKQKKGDIESGKVWLISAFIFGVIIGIAMTLAIVLFIGG